ncbi:MAG: family acetyltransferase [Rhodospirillales bacterium]|nr:family acetyltransferase [Rhodospirillales bacterium]
MIIRPTELADIPAITAIYAHHVLHGTGTFEEEPPGEAEIAARVAKVTAAGAAWRTALADDGTIAGYGYYAPFRERSAYRYTVEDSIYIRDDVRGQGVGKALVAELLEHATAAGRRQMMAVIGDSENTGSIGLHLSLGFRQIGVQRAVGIKFGRWLDVILMQKALGQGDRTLPTD